MMTRSLMKALLCCLGSSVSWFVLMMLAVAGLVEDHLCAYYGRKSLGLADLLAERPMLFFVDSAHLICTRIRKGVVLSYIIE